MQFIKTIFPDKLKRDIKENLGVPSLHRSLQNIKRLGFQPKFVIDIGAYQGHWTKDFLEVFPDVSLLMLEAQKAKEPYLKTISDGNNKIQYHIALLAANDGEELSFSEDETASHVTNNLTGTVRKIKAESLDAILERKGLPLPDFLKLDVQGFELEVLRGGTKALAHAEFCLLEVSLLNYDGSEPLMLQVMNFMDQQNFQVYDICQFMRRPFDLALDQMDVLFIRKDSAIIREKRWK